MNRQLCLQAKPNHQCLRLLVAHGTRMKRTWGVSAAITGDDPEAVCLLVDALGETGVPVADQTTENLPDAAAHASTPMIIFEHRHGIRPLGRGEGLRGLHDGPHPIDSLRTALI